MEAREYAQMLQSTLSEAMVKLIALREEVAALISQPRIEFKVDEAAILSLSAKSIPIAELLSKGEAIGLAFFKEHHSEGDEVRLPSIETKAVWPLGAANTRLSASEIGKELIEVGRTDDLLKVISISEKDLKSIDGGLSLVEKHKIQDGIKRTSPAFKAFNAEDRKLLG